MAQSSPRSRLRRLVELSAQLTGTTIGVATREPAVALSFDDGPDPAWTPRVLEVLERHGARGTFFMVGKSVVRWPEVVQRVVDGGHALGNHSWDHPSLPLLRGRARRAQIRWTADALATHGGTRLFRPPYGHQTPGSQLSAALGGHRVIAWDCIAEDWLDDPAEVLVARVERRLRPGSIVLFHDRLYTTIDHRFEDRTPTLEAVEQLLERHPDLRFVTVPELLRLGPARKWHWYQRSNLEWLRRLV